MELLIKKGTTFHNIDIQADAGLIITANNPFEFTFGKSFKTYTIQILNTGNNNQVLDNLFYKHYDETLKYEDVYIKIDGVYLRCILKVNKITGFYAEATAISSSGLLWDGLRSKNLKNDFDWSAYDHTLNTTNALNNSLFSGDVLYDFVNRGRGVSAPGTRNFDLAELQPAIRAKAIIDKIFSGYTVNQNVWSSAEYEAIYLLFCQAFSRNTEEWKETAAVYGQNDADIAITATVEQDLSTNTVWFADWISEIDGDMSVNASKTYRYTVPETGAYKVDLRLTLTFNIENDDSNSYSFINRHYIARVKELNSDGSLSRILHSKRVNLADASYINFSETREFTLDTKTVSVQSGKIIEIEIYYKNSVSLGSVNQSASASAGELDFVRVTPWQWYGQGDSVPGEYVVPDMTVQDFLTALYRMFNIEFYFSDETKQIYMQNRSTATLSVYDITDLILTDTGEIETEADPKNLRFGFVEDQKDTQRNYYNRIGGSDGSYFSDNGSPEEINLSIPFAFNFYVPGTSIISTKEGGDYSTDNVQRISYYNGTTSYSWTLEAANPAASGDTVTPSSLLQTVRRDFSNEYGTSYTLDYSDRTGEDGIFTRFYADLDERLKNQKVLELNMIVNADLLSSMYFVTGKDLRAVYYLGIEGIRGYYQIVELEKIQGNIYKALLYNDKLP
jgi:hypothetical protein